MRYFLLIYQFFGKVTDVLVDMLNRFLSSKTGLMIALIGPLAVISAPQPIKNVENIISSNWTQLWALFVLGIIGARAVKHSKQNSKDIEQLHHHINNHMSELHKRLKK